MRVLLTGTTGFLGSHLCNMLLHAGHNVVGTKRSHSDTWRLKDIIDQVEFVDAMSTDWSDFFAKGRPFDAVCHTATCYGRNQESPSEILGVNTSFPLSILDGAIRADVPLFINTDSCFSRRDLTYEYLRGYSLSKRQFAEWGKLLAQDKLIRFVNLKLQHPYGPKDARDKFVPFIVRECLQSEGSIDLTPGEQRKDFIFIEDVVSAFQCVLSARLEDYSLELECGTGRSTMIREFVETVHRLCESKMTLNFGALPYRENEVMDSVADPRALQSIGWSCQYSLEDGIREILGFES